VLGILRADLGVYGAGLPYVLFWIVRHAADVAVLGLGGLALVVVTAYVYRVERAEPETIRRGGVRLAAAGLVIMALGYAIFVVPTALSFSSASLGNRIRIAAALGTAPLLVGLIAVLASLVRRTAAARGTYAIGVGLVCAIGFVATNTLARFWVSAYREQQRIVANVNADLSRISPGSTVLLDGVCFERGGAYVFTGHRDVTGALSISYGGQSLTGSAITNPVKITKSGLTLRTVGAPIFVPYRKDLIVYDVPRRRARRLLDQQGAEQYFERSGFDPGEDCLPGFSWRGPSPPTD
jgi:hypothetical protein